MVLKLEAAKRALEGGVGEVHIVGGDSASAVLDPLLFSEAANKKSSTSLPGTRVLRESSAGLASQAVV
jgi:hypothetical protein